MGLHLSFLISIVMISGVLLPGALNVILNSCKRLSYNRKGNITWEISPNRQNNASYMLKLFEPKGDHTESKGWSDSHTLLLNGEKIDVASERPFIRVLYEENGCLSHVLIKSADINPIPSTFPVNVSYRTTVSNETFEMGCEFFECPADISNASNLLLSTSLTDSSTSSYPLLGSVDLDEDEDKPFDTITLIPLIISILVIMGLILAIVVILRHKRSDFRKGSSFGNVPLTEHNQDGISSRANSHLYAVLDGHCHNPDVQNSDFRLESVSASRVEESGSHQYFDIDEMNNVNPPQGGDGAPAREEFQYSAVTIQKDGQKETVRYKKSLIKNELYVPHQPSA